MKDKIVLVINSLQVGGAEKVLLNIAEYLYSDLHENVILVVLFPSTYKSNLPLGIEMLDLSKDSLLNKILMLNRLKREARVILSFLTFSNVLTLISKGIFSSKTRYIVAVRNDPFRENVSLITRLLSYCFYRFSHEVIVQTDQIKQDMINSRLYGSLKYQIIPNYYDKNNLMHFDSFDYDNLDLSEYHVKFLSVGTKIFQKGFDELIEIFNELLDNNINKFCLIIAGLDSNHIDTLRTKVKHKNIIILPKMHNLNYLFSQCDYYVLNSRYEGFPNTLLEAINHGLLPIMRKGVSGVSEIHEIIPESYEFKTALQLEKIVLGLTEDRKTLNPNSLYKVQNSYSRSTVLPLWYNLIKT